jgi:hypothetical protein
MNRMAYEIYQRLPSGGRFWVDSAETLEHASDRWAALRAKNEAIYVIYHSCSGKLLEPLGSIAGSSHQPSQDMLVKVFGTERSRNIVNKFKKLAFTLTNRRFVSPV